MLRPLSALSLDEGLNALSGNSNNTAPSIGTIAIAKRNILYNDWIIRVILVVKIRQAAGWYSRPIKCQILARKRISDSLYFRL
jgi:hypothetical protein